MFFFFRKTRGCCIPLSLLVSLFLGRKKNNLVRYNIPGSCFLIYLFGRKCVILLSLFHWCWNLAFHPILLLILYLWAPILWYALINFCTLEYLWGIFISLRCFSLRSSSPLPFIYVFLSFIPCAVWYVLSCLFVLSSCLCLKVSPSLWTMSLLKHGLSRLLTPHHCFFFPSWTESESLGCYNSIYFPVVWRKTSVELGSAFIWPLGSAIFPKILLNYHNLVLLTWSCQYARRLGNRKIPLDFESFCLFNLEPWKTSKSWWFCVLFLWTVCFVCFSFAEILTYWQWGIAPSWPLRDVLSLPPSCVHSPSAICSRFKSAGQCTKGTDLGRFCFLTFFLHNVF